MSPAVVSRVSIVICIPSHVTSGEVAAEPANTIRHIYQSWDRGEQDICFVVVEDCFRWCVISQPTRPGQKQSQKNYNDKDNRFDFFSLMILVFSGFFLIICVLMLLSSHYERLSVLPFAAVFIPILS